MVYTGIPEALRAEVYERDSAQDQDLPRCRWCGATNRGRDVHHIEYRRGVAFDVLENLITLCRQHHSFVHGTAAGNGDTITKVVAQAVLTHLIEHPGTTGLAVWRQLKRRWTLEGRCVKHGEKRDECLECRYEGRRHASG